MKPLDRRPSAWIGNDIAMGRKVRQKGVTMHVTIRRYSGSPGLADRLAENEDALRGLLTDIEGFRAYYLLRDDRGEATSVSVFDDESGAEASNRQAADWLRENLAELSVSPPEVSAGEA